MCVLYICACAFINIYIYIYIYPWPCGVVRINLAFQADNLSSILTSSFGFETLGKFLKLHCLSFTRTSLRLLSDYVGICNINVYLPIKDICPPIFICTCNIHIYIHVYIHTYIHTYIDICVRVYIIYTLLFVM